MIAVYAATNCDESVRSTSTSGGVFRALCEAALERGGVVYGARFDESMRVVHARAESLEGCIAFSGSKYVQSDIGDCYWRVADDLRAGKRVLFSGTPCQVAGLRSFLAIKDVQGDLLAVDLICHGVPSPLLWAEHVKFIEARNARVSDYRFRDKRRGWHNPAQVARTEQGDVEGYRVSAFSEIFDFNYALRPACHKCPFARLERAADVSLGDYWGVERYHPELDDGRGVSLVIVSTEKGRAALKALSEAVKLVSLSPDECDAPNLKRPTPPSPHRVAFWHTYRSAGYVGAIKRYTSYGLLRRVARRARKAVRGLINDH